MYAHNIIYKYNHKGCTITINKYYNNIIRYVLNNKLREKIIINITYSHILYYTVILFVCKNIYFSKDNIVVFTLQEGEKKVLSIDVPRLYTCDDLFTRTRVLIRFKTYYIPIPWCTVYACVCVCVRMITIPKRQNVLRLWAIKNEGKKNKNESLPTMTRTGQRLSNCPCAYTKPFITINCIVWTAALLL